MTMPSNEISDHINVDNDSKGIIVKCISNLDGGSDLLVTSSKR